MNTMNKKSVNYFSEHEKIIIKIVGRKKLSIENVTKTFFKTHHDYPLDANNYVAGVIRRIVRKCEHYKLPWSITGEGAGKHGRTVWRIKVARA